MALNLGELAHIVSIRDFQRLIGEIEGQFFDVKGQPYQFDFDTGTHAKREFAKDVAAFANAAGGYIFVGFSSKNSALQLGEEVAEVRPIDFGHFDVSRHHKLLSEWLYPTPRGIDIRPLQYGDNPTKGIGVIFVPPQDERVKPFLLKWTVLEKKSTELLVGLVERHIDRTEVRSVMEIHQALRIGFNLERELLGRIVNIESRIEQFVYSKQEQQTVERRRELLEQRINRLIAEDKSE